MDNRTEGLWAGGPWEQPSQALPPPPPAVFLPRSFRTPPPPPRRRRSGRAGFLVALLLIGAMTSLTVFLNGGLPDGLRAPWDQSEPSGEPGYNALEWEPDASAPPAIPQFPTGSGVVVPLSPATGQALSHTQIYEKNVPSIVALEAYAGNSVSTGTGIVMTADGYLITNAHIVAGSSRVNVVLSDDSIWSAELVGFESREDLAVLKIQAQGLTPAEFGDSNLLRCGDQVSAIGNPLGYRSTITPGIVSALDQRVDVDGAAMYLIQTSAAINYGSSGGALINDRGQVIGVTTIKIVSDDGSAEGLGFAIPMTRVKQVVDCLIAGQSIQHPTLGITVRRSQTPPDGLVVEELQANSDCLAKGLRRLDVIVAANGQTVRTADDLERVKRTLGVGDTLLLKVARGQESLEFSVALMDANDFPS